MTTQSPLITGTDFITVATADFERAIEFYGGVLGLPESKRLGRDARRRVRDRQPDDRDHAVRRLRARSSAPTNHPIELGVDDVAAARAELESRGVAFEADTLDSGVCHQAFFSDPDGNALAIHHRYAPAGVGPS